MATVDDVYNLVHDLRADFREHKGRTEERLDELEASRKWDNYRTYAIGPILVALHYIGSRLGMKG